MATIVPSKSKGTIIRVKPITRKKLEAIRRAKRWAFTEAVDAMADEFMTREGIRLPESKSPEASVA